MTATLTKSTPATDTVGSVNLLTDVITKGRELPAGYDGWLIRTVHADFRSRNDYRYPFPGSVAEAPGPFLAHNAGGCPAQRGDGICAATTWEGMASGGVAATTLLLVAYRESDVLGREAGNSKLRLREFLIVDLIDGARLVREEGKNSNLRSANLGYANLRYANLGYANLGYANLRSADLRSANLRSANLGYANLGYADLRSANLGSADLGYANLGSADLGYADLRTVAGLTQLQVDSAYTNEWTQLPSGLTIPTRSAS